MKMKCLFRLFQTENETEIRFFLSLVSKPSSWQHTIQNQQSRCRNSEPVEDKECQTWGTPSNLTTPGTKMWVLSGLCNILAIIILIFSFIFLSALRQCHVTKACWSLTPSSSGKGPFLNHHLLFSGLVHSFGPHPPTQPLMDHLTLRLPLHPVLHGLKGPLHPLNGLVH